VAWTEEELRAVLRRWEVALLADGKTSATVATYVRDARAFIDYAAGAPRRTGHGETARVRRARPASMPGSSSPIAVPDDLRRLYQGWLAAGRPGQMAFPWPRSRWVAEFPEHGSALRSLAPRLGRVDVREVARHAGVDGGSAVVAFLVVMAWGFGNVGYGPHRTRRILELTPDAPARLHKVAVTMASGTPTQAYSRLAGDCRLRGLGPSFGTKYLAFCQPPSTEPVALILDNLVLEWLAAHGRADLMSATWSPVRYKSYLEQARVWADDLGCDPETVEWLIFQSASNDRGNQWADG